LSKYRIAGGGRSGGPATVFGSLEISDGKLEIPLAIPRVLLE
jgi:hypothetical protein